MYIPTYIKEKSAIVSSIRHRYDDDDNNDDNSIKVHV